METAIMGRPKVDLDTLTDVALAARIVIGDVNAATIVVQRNNQRLFRAALSILSSRSEAEDALQSAYVRAFAGMAEFGGRSSLSTWLTRIVINEALGRLRAARRRKACFDGNSVLVLDEYRDKLMRGSTAGGSPEYVLAHQQLRQILESAIAALPLDFRLVFVLRDIEGLSIEEAAAALEVPQATVKTRHLRARRRLQKLLDPEIRTALQGTFPFAGEDCQALTARLMQQFRTNPQLIAMERQEDDRVAK
ncbi:RNA polymerase sigma factor [Sphingobium indicum]|nr:RNA polymerase sigma factor [Sphingobium indicum]